MCSMKKKVCVMLKEVLSYKDCATLLVVNNELVSGQGRVLALSETVREAGLYVPGMDRSMCKLESIEDIMDVLMYLNGRDGFLSTSWIQ